MGGSEVVAMPSHNVDCPEVVGKTVKSLKLYQADDGSSEIMIDFTDGTSFASAYEPRSVLKASLIQTGSGAPDVLKNYID